MAKCVLIVDDDPAQRRILQEVINRFGYETRLATGGQDALEILSKAGKSKISLVLLDLVMPDVDGMAVLERMQSDCSALPIIVQTAHGSVDAAISAMRAGATDFVIKPVSPERLEISIRNALKINALEGEIKRISRHSTGKLTFDDFITRSDSMKRVIELGKRAATSNIPVLIEGESGVGKELIARAIQGESDRAGKPFVTVNCGAIPENLVESILFGHEKGSFTGAAEKRKGKFVEAHGGTLFLDEIGELPLDAQVKLLRALQDGEVDPVGAKSAVKSDFRLISATNLNLIDEVKADRFREDLYYRMNVFPIWVPPLRDRLCDVADLIQHFVRRFAAEEGKTIEAVDRNAMAMLTSYTWPGNVRQLENAVFRAIVLTDSSTLTIAEFPQIAAHVEGYSAELPPAPAPVSDVPRIEGPAMIGSEVPVAPTKIILPDGSEDAVGIPALTDAGDIRPLHAIEADMIKLAMGRYRGRMTEIAKKLGIGRSTLYRKMREIGLQPRAS